MSAINRDIGLVCATNLSRRPGPGYTDKRKMRREARRLSHTTQGPDHRREYLNLARYFRR